MACAGCGQQKVRSQQASYVAPPEDWSGRYVVTLPDGSVEDYGTLIPARRRAREVGGRVTYAGGEVV